MHRAAVMVTPDRVTVGYSDASDSPQLALHMQLMLFSEALELRSVPITRDYCAIQCHFMSL